MPARTAARKQSKARKWLGPRHEITVADPMTIRTARAIATDYVWKKSQDDYRMRQLEATIEVEYAGSSVDQNTEVYLNVKVSEYRGQTERELTISELQLGDLPLLVLALQEAIRVGVERGTLPEIWAPRKARSA